jgi:hypothetical protein
MVPLDRVSFSFSGFYVLRMLNNFNSFEMPFFKLYHVEVDLPTSFRLALKCKVVPESDTSYR